MSESRAEAASKQTTVDLAEARRELDRNGCCVIADALSPAVVAALRERLDEQAHAEREAGVGYFDGAADQNWGSFRDASGKVRADAFTEAHGGVNQRIWMLVNKGEVFIELLGHPQVRALIDHLMGEHYLLSSYIANIANPGGVAMKLHTDQWWAPKPTRRERRNLPVGSITRERTDFDDRPLTMIAPAACCNVMWMLDDFTEDNGATRIVPGSHLSGEQPPADAESIAACALAGSVMIFDGRLWHGTGANRSASPRRGLLTTFCGPQYRPQENYTIGTLPEVLDAASDDLRELLGLRVWSAYGRTGDPTVEFVSPSETTLGAMRPARKEEPT